MFLLLNSVSSGRVSGYMLCVLFADLLKARTILTILVFSISQLILTVQTCCESNPVAGKMVGLREGLAARRCNKKVEELSATPESTLQRS